ncbi:MAG: cytochrome c oxidase subunit 3 [Gammaproteobacteria bacterium]|nr:cytochrome c oxidase subunit 3 [Gammaproteobacteria bacterium]
MSILQQLTAKSWETQGALEDIQGEASLALPDAKVGFWVFLGVITMVFALFAVAYNMRLELGDWRPLADPAILWLNTAVLIISSIAMQVARVAADTGNVNRTQLGLTIGGLCSIAFLVGQFWAWQQLRRAGFFLTSSPADAFFYLITGLHGLHVLGGLWVWARTSAKVWGGAEIEKVRLSVELCTVYWHFLLIVWAVLFGLLLST